MLQKSLPAISLRELYEGKGKNKGYVGFGMVFRLRSSLNLSAGFKGLNEGFGKRMSAMRLWASQSSSEAGMAYTNDEEEIFWVYGDFRRKNISRNHLLQQPQGV